MCISVFYHPPSSPSLIFEDLFLYLQSLNIPEFCNYILLGDFIVTILTLFIGSCSTFLILFVYHKLCLNPPTYVLFERYKKLCNRVTTQSRSAKTSFFRQINPCDTKKFWKSVTYLNKNQSSIPVLSQGNTLACTDSEKADILFQLFQPGGTPRGSLLYHATTYQKTTCVQSMRSITPCQLRTLARQQAQIKYQLTC